VLSRSYDARSWGVQILPGTIIDQHTAAGKKVEASGAVDVTSASPPEAAAGVTV
jgi:hypothetical protein